MKAKDIRIGRFYATGSRQYPRKEKVYAVAKFDRLGETRALWLKEATKYEAKPGRSYWDRFEIPADGRWHAVIGSQHRNGYRAFVGLNTIHRLWSEHEALEKARVAAQAKRELEREREEVTMRGRWKAVAKVLPKGAIDLNGFVGYECALEITIEQGEAIAEAVKKLQNLLDQNDQVGVPSKP